MKFVSRYPVGQTVSVEPIEVSPGGRPTFATLLAYTPDDGGKIIEFTEITPDTTRVLERVKEGEEFVTETNQYAIFRREKGYLAPSRWEPQIDEWGRDDFVAALEKRGLTLSMVKDRKHRYPSIGNEFNLAHNRRVTAPVRIFLANPVVRKDVTPPSKCVLPDFSRMG